MDYLVYERDWLTNEDSHLSCAEFFITDMFNNRFHKLGYTVKNRNKAGVFLMLDKGKAIPKEFYTHAAHVCELIKTLDKIHDILDKNSERRYRVRSWHLSHVDIHNLVTLAIESPHPGNHRLLFQIGVSTVYFNLDTQSMIDVVLSLKDMADRHHLAITRFINEWPSSQKESS